MGPFSEEQCKKTAIRGEQSATFVPFILEFVTLPDSPFSDLKKAFLLV